ncbi:MAG: hypothetical protein KDA37_03675, partial [Planctomycetales bacterium]|nr:hypothetical protein [Planctomycetales bacterium]
MLRATPTIIPACTLLGWLLIAGSAAAQGAAQASDDAPPMVGDQVEPAQAATKDADEPGQRAGSPEPAPQAAEPQPPTEPPAPTPADPQSPGEIVLSDWLVLPRVGDYTRTIVALDPIDAQLASGEWQTPKEGDEVTGADGRTHKWRRYRADEPAVIRSSEAAGGYAAALLDSPAERVAILHAERHASACVNGEWFTGDPYGHGWVRLPVLLKKGPNELLFHMVGPGFQARLIAASEPAYLLAEDATLPDVVREEQGETWAAVPVVNAANEPLVGAKLRVRTPSGATTLTNLPSIAPLCVYKAAFRFTPDRSGADKTAVFVDLVLPANNDENIVGEARLDLRQVSQDAQQTRTFVSGIDGSVQPYSLVPAVSLADSPPSEPPGIILALHNTGVDHSRHASYYQPKDWAHLVAPQNRRAVGFEWEDWGATDALEALADAQTHVDHDPSRTYLTGHSMGGHGALTMALRNPARFRSVSAFAPIVQPSTAG